MLYFIKDPRTLRFKESLQQHKQPSYDVDLKNSEFGTMGSNLNFVPLFHCRCVVEKLICEERRMLLPLLLRVCGGFVYLCAVTDITSLHLSCSYVHLALFVCGVVSLQGLPACSNGAEDVSELALCIGVTMRKNNIGSQMRALLARNMLFTWSHRTRPC